MLTLEKRFLAKPCAEIAGVRSAGLTKDCSARRGVWKTWPTPTPRTIWRQMIFAHSVWMPKVVKSETPIYIMALPLSMNKENLPFFLTSMPVRQVPSDNGTTSARSARPAFSGESSRTIW